MAEAQEGDKVKVHYKGMLEDGKVFDESRSGDRDPLEFTIGEGKIIPGFEEAVKGMSPGETSREKISCQEAYGQRREDLVVNLDRSELPDDLDPEPGQQLQMKQKDGRQLNVIVTDTDDSTVTVDANHPLADHDLEFDIELVGIA